MEIAYKRPGKPRAWKVIGKFPFVQHYIRDFSTVTFKDAMYTFGGYADGKPTDLVARFNGKWKKINSLAGPRRGHSSVVVGNTIVHIGAQENWYVNLTCKFFDVKNIFDVQKGRGQSFLRQKIFTPKKLLRQTHF